MKKTIFILSILFSINCMGQDTTFFQKRNDLYMTIRSRVVDSTIYKQQYSLKLKKRRRNDKIMTIVVGTIFSGISVWFWSGYTRYSN